MKQTKRRIEAFSFFNLDGIRLHLEKMASKGWMIDKLGTYSWTYQRIEPQNILFTVSYFPKASEFDPEPTEEQQRFIDFCSHTGWKLACSSAQLQIFYNENENPTPIETEPVLELDAIHASAKKGFIPAYIVLLLLGIFQGGLWISSLLGDPIGLLADPTRLFTGFCWMILFVLTSVELLCYFSWYRKARPLAEQGLFLSPPNTVKFQKMILAFLLVGFLYWLFNSLIFRDDLYKWIIILVFAYIFLLNVITHGTKAFLKHKKVSRGLNRTVTILICFIGSFALMAIVAAITLFASSKGYFNDNEIGTYEYNGATFSLQDDELPLTIEDLMETDYNDYIRARRGNGSIFLSQYVMEQYPRFDADNYEQLPEMEYTIVTVKMPFLYETCKNRMIYEEEELYRKYEFEHQYEYQLADSAPWNADCVYQLYDNEYGFRNKYLLCYDSSLIEICFNWEPTIEQMNIVGEKLGGK